MRRPALLLPLLGLLALGLLFDLLYFRRWQPEFDFYRQAERQEVLVQRVEASIAPDDCGGKACEHLWVARSRLQLQGAMGNRVVGEAYANRKALAEERIASLKAWEGRRISLYLSAAQPEFFAERPPVFLWLQASTLLLVTVLTMLPFALGLRAYLRGWSARP